MHLLILIICGIFSVSAFALSAAAVRKENRTISQTDARKREWRGSAPSEQVQHRAEKLAESQV
jgi:hypothetical protein